MSRVILIVIAVRYLIQHGIIVVQEKQQELALPSPNHSNIPYHSIQIDT